MFCREFFVAEDRFAKAIIFRFFGLTNFWSNSTMNYTSPKAVPESIAASLARSEAQDAAGQNVPLEPMLDRLRASIARMQADGKLKATTTLKV